MLTFTICSTLALAFTCVAIRCDPDNRYTLPAELLLLGYEILTLCGIIVLAKELF